MNQSLVAVSMLVVCGQQDYKQEKVWKGDPCLILEQDINHLN